MLNIILTGLTSLFTDISTEMVYPLLPMFLTSTLGATPAIVGVIEGIAESLASLLKVFAGVISDKLGKRKPLTIAGYSFSTIGKVFLYFAGSWRSVLLGRVTDRFGKGIRTAPRDALIAESCDPSKRGAAFGLHRFMDTLGASIGIVLAYLLVNRYRGDFRPIFMLSLIPAFIGVSFLFFIKEGPKQVSAGKKLSFDWKSLNPRLRAFLVVTFIFTLGNSSNQFLLMRARDLGYDPAKVILLYLTYNLVYSLASYPAGALSDKIGRRQLLVAGYFFYGVVYLGFALASKKALPALFAIYGLYIALTEGVEKALVSDIAPAESRATLIGLHATLVGIGLLPASALAGFLWNTMGPKAPFVFGGVMGLLASVLLSIVLRTTPSQA